MSKRDLIECIRRLNPTAQPDFLARFTEPNLLAYLQQLQDLESERHRRPVAAPPVLAHA